MEKEEYDPLVHNNAVEMSCPAAVVLLSFLINSCLIRSSNTYFMLEWFRGRGV